MCTVFPAQGAVGCHFVPVDFSRKKKYSFVSTNQGQATAVLWTVNEPWRLAFYPGYWLCFQPSSGTARHSGLEIFLVSPDFISPVLLAGHRPPEAMVCLGPQPDSYGGGQKLYWPGWDSTLGWCVDTDRSFLLIPVSHG